MMYLRLELEFLLTSEYRELSNCFEEVFWSNSRHGSHFFFFFFFPFPHEWINPWILIFFVSGLSSCLSQYESCSACHFSHHFSKFPLVISFVFFEDSFYFRPLKIGWYQETEIGLTVILFFFVSSSFTRQ